MSKTLNHFFAEVFNEKIAYIEVWANTKKFVPPPWQKCYTVMKVLKFMQGHKPITLPPDCWKEP